MLQERWEASLLKISLKVINEEMNMKHIEKRAHKCTLISVRIRIIRVNRVLEVPSFQPTCLAMVSSFYTSVFPEYKFRPC